MRPETAVHDPAYVILGDAVALGQLSARCTSCSLRPEPLHILCCQYGIGIALPWCSRLGLALGTRQRPTSAAPVQVRLEGAGGLAAGFTPPPAVVAIRVQLGADNAGSAVAERAGKHRYRQKSRGCCNSTRPGGFGLLKPSRSGGGH
jgi:hypothetical protein